MVERHLGWLDRAPSPWAAMTFAAWSALALHRAQALSPTELFLHRPGHGDRTAARISAVELADQLAGQATGVAERFDRRNGTDNISTQVLQILQAEQLLEYLPLSPTAPRVLSTVLAGPSTVLAGSSTVVTGPSTVGSEIDRLVEAVADRTAHGDAAAAADHRHSLAIAYRDAGRLIDAAEVAEEELAYRLRAGGDGSVTAHPVRALLVTIYEGLGQPDEAIAQLDAIVDECQRAGDRTGVARGIEAAGKLLRRTGREDEAAVRFLAAADAYGLLGRHRHELRNRRRHAFLLLWEEGPEQAMPALRAADSLATRLVSEAAEPRLLRELGRLDRVGAMILWHAGEYKEAAERAGRAAEFAQRCGRPRAANAAERLRMEILAEVPPDGE
jgi:tetratricopeptide (TPR) repeat protein